ncbi:MAG: S8 family serine peptidase, partial [Dehalococcoidia bacterium]|nr:S8 family serine peptidase [Dehalococcoidia bacterium]
GSNYCQKAGTSMASPHVAGVAALVWSVNPSLTPDQVESIMRQSAVDLGSAGWDDVFGYGRVDAYQAVVATPTLTYAAQFSAQSFPASMVAGQTFTASVDVQNTGGATWFQGGSNPVRLGASQPLDRASPFYTAGNWVNASRPAALSQSSVAPGQVGRFTFALTAPAQGGTFTENFQVVVEGKGWLDQPVIWFRVPVSVAGLSNTTYLPSLFQGVVPGW